VSPIARYNLNAIAERRNDDANMIGVTTTADEHRQITRLASTARPVV
jgi:hypothetical protein